MSCGASKTVLVTGGAGFLGSWLCERLLDAGSRVICVDNLMSGRLSNLAGCQTSNDFVLLQHDVIDPLCIDEKLHEIYNLACPASPVRYQADPIHTFKTSIIGAMNMLELAYLHGARLLQASTSEVYGDPECNPQTETYFGNVNTYGPRSCYDEGKRAAETIIREYHLQRAVDTKIARIFNTYGPRMRHDDGRVVSNFIVQALMDEDITVYGDGMQTRSFCYVDDQIDGLMALMASPDSVDYPMNIGNPEEHTMLDLVELVLEKTGSRSRLVYMNMPLDDPHVRRPDIASARTKLGWAPTVTLDEGLDRTIEHFREVRVSGVLSTMAAE